MLFSLMLAAASFMQPLPEDLATLDATLEYEYSDVQVRDMRCSAVFAIIAKGQDDADRAAMAYPTMEPEAKDFFDGIFAGIMEEKGLDNDALLSEMILVLKWQEQRMQNSGNPLQTLNRDAQECLPLLQGERFDAYLSSMK